MRTTSLKDKGRHRSGRRCLARSSRSIGSQFWDVWATEIASVVNLIVPLKASDDLSPRACVAVCNVGDPPWTTTMQRCVAQDGRARRCSARETRDTRTEVQMAPTGPSDPFATKSLTEEGSCDNPPATKVCSKGLRRRSVTEGGGATATRDRQILVVSGMQGRQHRPNRTLEHPYRAGSMRGCLNRCQC